MCPEGLAPAKYPRAERVAYALARRMPRTPLSALPQAWRAGAADGSQMCLECCARTCRLGAVRAHRLRELPSHAPARCSQGASARGPLARHSRGCRVNFRGSPTGMAGVPGAPRSRARSARGGVSHRGFPDVPRGLHGRTREFWVPKKAAALEHAGARPPPVLAHGSDQRQARVCTVRLVDTREVLYSCTLCAYTAGNI